MRWKDLRTWEDMIAAATKLHDGIYPSQSPVPSQKMCGCKNPEAQCVKLAVASKTQYGWQCTVPTYVPALQQPTDCDRRIYDWKEGQSAQSMPKDAKAPTVADGTTTEILAWVRKTLDYLCVNAGMPSVRIAAAMLLEDGDVPVSMQTYEVLGNMMLDRYHLDKPHKKGA